MKEKDVFDSSVRKQRMNLNEFIKHVQDFKLPYLSLEMSKRTRNNLKIFALLNFSCQHFAECRSIGTKGHLFMLLGFNNNKRMLKYFYIFIFC